MNIIKTLLLVLSIAAFTNCSKDDDDNGPACEENETTKVTFTNSSNATLRVEVASQFNAQFEPVSPVFTADIAPNTSSVREFRYGQYFIQWKNDCPNTCTQRALYSKTYAQCQEYTETQ